MQCETCLSMLDGWETAQQETEYQDQPITCDLCRRTADPVEPESDEVELVE